MPYASALSAPSCRPGVGLDLSNVYAWIGSNSASGANQLGDISSALLNLGLTVEAARTALNTVAHNVGGNPQQLAVINAELNFLNTHGAPPAAQNWGKIILGLGLIYLVYLATQDGKETS
jgi:hypothetical protein